MRLDVRIPMLAVLAAGAMVLSSYVSDLSTPAARAVAQVAPTDSVKPVAPPAAPRRAAHAAAAASMALPSARGKAGASAAPPAAYTHFRVGERNVKRIFVDGARVWVATSGGVIRYEPASDDYRLYDQRSGLKSGNAVFVGKVGERIAAGTAGGGLALLDEATQQWETYGPDEGIVDAVVHDVMRASNGDIWIATRAGVNRVRGGALREHGSWERYTVAGTGGSLPSDRAYALAEGRDGDIWLATESGVARYRAGTWSHWSGPGAPSGFAVALSVDRRGHVWAGTLGSGLGHFDGASWRNYTADDGLPGNHVFTLHRDAKGLLWVGTDRGLARMKDGRFRVMTTRDGLYGNAVFAMASAPDALWVGSFGGVARIRSAP
jgi:ligand-binding sensor domain-containing protein